MRSGEAEMLREQLALQRAYASVFTSPDGQLVLADLEARGFMRLPSYSPEPGRTEFNEGRRSLVLHIREMMSEQARDRILGRMGQDQPQNDGGTSNG